MTLPLLCCCLCGTSNPATYYVEFDGNPLSTGSDTKTHYLCASCSRKPTPPKEEVKQ